MRMFSKALYGCICSILIISACQKKEKETEVPSTADGFYVEVKNNTGDTIHFDCIDTSSGYIIGAPYRLIAPDRSIKIPYNLLASSGFHYLYYNDDKTITNIPDFWVYGFRLIPYPNAKDFLIVIPDSPRKEYMKCLTAKATGTDWKAVNAYDNSGTSVWGTMSPDERSQAAEVDTINAWQMIHLTYKGYVNNKNVYQKMWAVQTTKGKFEMSFRYSTPGLRLTIMDDCRPAAPLYTTSLDTMYMKVDSIPYYYKMYRVK